jgi:energy-coupling factor transporter ATP-binding protein EcfA2
MDQAAVRTVTSQLSEDLSWLEGYAHGQEDGAGETGVLRMAAGLVRNVLGPYLEGQPPLPLHVAVVGGAGAGKSTLANLLIGSMQAESNPQAGYTRHPIAFVRGDLNFAWPASLGFLGPLQKLATHEPSRLDRDVYQIRRVSLEPNTVSVLDQFAVWDCPDMTTWAASHYAPRLLEVASLADVLVYVASDERYNDEVPTRYLRLFLEAGKTVVVVLVKMREADVPAFVAHFKKEIASKMPGPPLACLTIPQLTREQLADPIRKAAQYRIPILNQLAVIADPVEKCRERTVRAALAFLKDGQPRFLRVARQDLDALEHWQRTVRDGQTEFESRYEHEFLTSEKFRRFDEALLRLLDLLELPGVGKVLGTTMYVLATPYRWLKGMFGKPQIPSKEVAEKPVLDSALQGWVDAMRKEAAFHADASNVWKHIHQGFQSGLGNDVKSRFEQSFPAFQLALHQEVEQTARSIFEDIERNPALLNTLRGTKFTLEVGSLVASVAAGIMTFGVGSVFIGAATASVLASLTRYLVDFFGETYVDGRKQEARARQKTLVHQMLTQPLAEFLRQWPNTSGSPYERLKLALKRIPLNVQQLEEFLATSRKSHGSAIA